MARTTNNTFARNVIYHLVRKKPEKHATYHYEQQHRQAGEMKCQKNNVTHFIMLVKSFTIFCMITRNFQKWTQGYLDLFWRKKNDKICEKWKQEDWLRTHFYRKVAWYPSTFLRLFGNRSFLSWRNAQLASTAAATSLLSVSPFCSQLFLAHHPVLRAWLSCALPVVNFYWVPYTMTENAEKLAY